MVSYKPEKGKDKRGVTGADTKKLLEISEKINTSSDDLNLHKTIVKILNNRKEAVKKGSNIDWSTAEALAFGSLIRRGISSKISWPRLRKRNI